MSGRKFQPSSIKNKIKREDEARKAKRAKRQDKLQRRLALAKEEANDPALKRERLAKNVPHTLDNTREFDPSYLTANPAAVAPSLSSATQSGPSQETVADISADPFSDYFSSERDPTIPPKVLVTTSPRATKASYTLCEELVSLVPGAEFIRRKKGKDFVLGKIASWCAGRGYSSLLVVNENTKKPNAITMVHLPNGPTAYFKLSSIQYAAQISGHARPTTHYPELVLNNFVTRLGHTVGRMFQTLFPPMPEFQGRQVVTLHNQRDFLFLRRHRYAFRSEEKVALQEIGPRFTLKMKWLKKGIPATQDLGEPSKTLEFDVGGDEPSVDQAAVSTMNDEEEEEARPSASLTAPPKANEYEWQWKPELETTRRTFFL